MSHKVSVFLFHRDLRLDDNTGLLRALEKSEKVIPCFILEDKQLENNSFRGDHCMQFMIESLEDLNEQLKAKKSQLYVFKGDTTDILEKLFKEIEVDAFYSNADYTPFSRKRDKEIEDLCKKNSIEFNRTQDALIIYPDQVAKDDGDPYVVFTPFKKKAQEREVLEPESNSHSNYYSKKISLSNDISIFSEVLEERNEDLWIHGGRSNALKQLKKISSLESYDESRNIPSKTGTTSLSAHHKFGTISMRETYHEVCRVFGPDHTLVSELYWHDFFSHVGYHFPHVFKGAFREKYDKLQWSSSEKDFENWCNGTTGFPIVDAGMRELNATGYMHNRVRMVVASFLVKDLHINWQKGEKYFAQKLIDYDPAINNGNWQWAASTGCDAQPYFRIFNPWSQQKKYDPDCIYIKKWIPELKGLEPKYIHKWEKVHSESDIQYPAPIIDHSKESKATKEMFKSVV